MTLPRSSSPPSLDLLVAQMPIGVVSFDPHGQLSYANSQARAWFAAEPDLVQQVRRPRPPPFEVRFPAQGEPLRLVVKVEQVILDQGQMVYLLSDITGQRQRDLARVQLISMISHELRNPLHTLSGFLKLVIQEKTGPLNELQREFLELADNQAGHLKARIIELIEFSRIDAGKLRLTLAPTDLNDLIATTIAQFQIQADQAQIALINAADADLPLVTIDGMRIGQVLINLIENAIKATPAGGQITVLAAYANHEVTLAVEDTGVGIAPQDQAHIFEPFTQLRRDQPDHGGPHLGLGLAICQQIIEGHGGQLSLMSALGKGSRFICHLPV